MSEEFDAGVYDFLASTAAAAQERAEEVVESSSFSSVGATTGGVPIWDGVNYIPGSLTGDSGFGLSVTVVTSPSLGLQVTVSNPATMRTGLGLGGLAVLNAAAASADTAPAQTAAYVQADVQAILTELRDLKTTLRSAGILTP